MAHPTPIPSSSSGHSAASSSRPSTSGTDVPPVPSTSFFVPDDHLPSSDGGHGDSPRDPFKTPDASVPSTPNPPSVVSFSGFADHPVYRRHDSRISVQSARRSHHSIQELPGSPSLSTSASSSGLRAQRNSFMPPLPMRQSALHTPATQASRASMVPPRAKKPMRSTMLAGAIEKPWLGERDGRATVAYWIVYMMAFIGVAAGAVRCYFAYAQTLRLGNLCLVMEDNFDSFDTENTWTREVSMSGFG